MATLIATLAGGAALTGFAGYEREVATLIATLAGGAALTGFAGEGGRNQRTTSERGVSAARGLGRGAVATGAPHTLRVDERGEQQEQSEGE